MYELGFFAVVLCGILLLIALAIGMINDEKEYERYWQYWEMKDRLREYEEEDEEEDEWED